MARPLVQFFVQSSSGVLQISAKHNSRLFTVLMKEGFASDSMFKCAGKLECGRCVVQVDPLVAGDAQPSEMELLEASGKGAEGFRCSCQLRIGTEMAGKVVRLLG